MRNRQEEFICVAQFRRKTTQSASQEHRITLKGDDKKQNIKTS